MAKPYFIYKTSNGVYYAELLLPDGTHANKKSTGCKNRAEAERVVMGWVVNGNNPARTNEKAKNKTTVDKITFFNNLRNYDFTPEEVSKIAQTLQDRHLIQSFILPNTPQSKTIEQYLEEFWNYNKSPYVLEKKLRGQSIHRDYCIALMTRIRIYWFPLLAGKSVGEITRDDINQIFTDDSVAKLAPKTINSIVSAITIPMKWAYLHGLTNNIQYGEPRDVKTADLRHT